VSRDHVTTPPFFDQSLRTAAGLQSHVRNAHTKGGIRVMAKKAAKAAKKTAKKAVKAAKKTAKKK
jgi:hypothetical protein